MVLRRVAVLVETSTSWGERIVRGVAAYAREHGPWLFYLEPRGRYEQLDLPSGWEGDGVIARVTSEKLASQITRAGLPAVNVSSFHRRADSIPQCTVDEERCAVMGAEHLLERGLRSFAYCGPVNRPGYVDRMGDAFVRIIREAGFPCHRYSSKRYRPGGRYWQANMDDLGRWLSGLPKPVGLIAWNDIRGRQVTEACQYFGLAVPEEIAVLGGGYDELMGAVSTPPLSTIDASAEKVGFEAAALLDRMMAGGAPPKRRMLIEPRAVITQQSTDVLVINDPHMRTAIRFIREHAHERIDVADVLAKVPLSRRVLEQRFRKLLGRSPAAEIRRVRLERARALLEATMLPIPDVAHLSGFTSPEIFARAFRHAEGMSPSSYRRKMRVG